MMSSSFITVTKTLFPSQGKFTDAERKHNSTHPRKKEIPLGRE
jgi:hypothetical protein